jgi:iron complex transport system substrate-binding protein
MFLVSCINHTENEVKSGQFIEKSEIELIVEDAKGFELIYTDLYTVLVSKSIDGNSPFSDSLFLEHEGYNRKSSRKTVNSKLASICCQSSTHLAYLDFLGVLNSVSGHCGLKFISNPAITAALEKNGTEEICAGENVQFERILSTDPDVFLVYPFAAEEVKDLSDKGIPTFMIAEYLEQTPLGRLEWIKLFAVLYGKESEANNYYNQVKESYNGLIVAQKDTNLNFIFNLPFGDTWYTPSANSLVVTLFEDAGMDYFYSGEKGTENTPHTKEEVWANGGEANYWVIIASRPEGFSLQDLKNESEVYKNFKSVKNEQVIFCNSATTDYFLSGVIEPEIMLKDILFAIHKMDQHQPKYFHLLK